ncbi:MAG: GDSL-type esterase/lipase family protein [Oscillatoria sp. PMC 1051.18]|nr:GDSL-type esterase/lipase family protein [Oscillatoria sp. PMC 1050.18]MEC5029024.1 GDSL-type esterase/lipase family protein [Oscillatoria sp. PMC 1051.18]
MYLAFIGDSFVNGTGDKACLGWTGRICADACQQGYNITYYNLGVRGETSLDIKLRWYQEVSCRLPKTADSRVIFSFGANDTTKVEGKTRVDFEDSGRNLESILKVAKQEFPVLMVGIPPIADDLAQNQRIARLSDKFAEVCSQLNIPYLDVFTPLQTSQVWLSEAIANDGAHPRNAGYTELANLVKNWSAWLSWLR